MPTIGDASKTQRDAVMLLVNNTPLETHIVNNTPILVKREDLCCLLPGPPFSKMRGVIAHIAGRKEQVIGVLDTMHSQAGWAVSYAGHLLGRKVINFWPIYKAQSGIPPQQLKAQELGAHLFPLQAGRSAILFHKAVVTLQNYHDSYMMPNALKIKESVTENAAEAKRTASQLPDSGTILISISSGTVASGVIRGLDEADALRRFEIILHMGYSRSEQATLDYVRRMSGVMMWSPVIIDEGYGYADKVDIDTPFPCNPYYDAKAFKWLRKNIDALKKPIIFWNIGA